MADQFPRSTFVRPAGSKAVQIVNPISGERQLFAVVQNPGSNSPASLRPTATDSSDHKVNNAENILNIEPERLSFRRENNPTLQDRSRIQNPPSRLHSLASHHMDGADKSAGQALDIYARAFVPETLRIINTLKGYEIHTPAGKQIDFGTYVRGWSGLDILSPMPVPFGLPLNTPLDLSNCVTPSQYELFFRYHLEAEIQSQKQENDDYSLYGHEVVVSFDGLGKAVAACSIVVPGLRENSPYVEEDDIVQLRQLHYDPMGRPLGMEQWLALRPFHGGASGLTAPLPQWPAPGWTNTIYNGRISSVQRRQELLVVGVYGLLAQNAYISTKQRKGENYTLQFNIQFPVPEKRYFPMRQALSIVQEAFKQPDASRTHHQETYRIPNTAHTINSTLPPLLYGSSQPVRASEKPRTWLLSMLFPTEQDCDVQTNLNSGYFSRPFFDKEMNYEQKKAIESICSHDFGTLPFLISGPPGTGKTKTLVEIAIQLIKNVDKVSHILFCAPSDPAADTVVHRLSTYFKPSELLRLNKPTRTFAEVPGAVLPFCFVSQNKFDLPPFKELLSHKIVVTTCRDASLLLYARLTNADLYAAEDYLRSSIHPYTAQPSQVELHWTALLMDESAQAIEPEALIPLSVVAPPLKSSNFALTPLFVMAGDEHQLGPRTSLRSSPLRASLFARLFARPVYSAHPLARGKTGNVPPPLSRSMLPINRPAFTSLIRNYRSHPAILAIPSALFYADTLEPEATDTNRLSGWSQWRGRQWPVLFRNNDAEDTLEVDSGGWFNIGEAEIACTYASLLVQTGLVEQKEICIMTPFKAQVLRIRKMIRKEKYRSLWDIDVGPTEAFQGLERGVVILCTTRSKQRFVKSDQKVDWGIIGLPNKMNVALTRAKFGLIVIGKKEILAQDPNWSAFLEFCIRNGLVHMTDGDETTHGGGHTEVTRLEKVLIAKERDSTEPQLWGDNNDEMTSGADQILDLERMNIYDRYDDDEDENE